MYDEFDDHPEEFDDEPELIACPECGAEIYEESVQCPQCGHYITADTSPWRGRGLWWIVLGALGVLATIFALALAP